MKIDGRAALTDIGAQMFPRLLLWLVMVIGLAVTPVSPALSCGDTTMAKHCNSCCADMETSCCTVSSSESEPVTPAKIAPSNTDLKTVPMPVLTLLCLQPLPPVEHPAVLRQSAARLPAQPVLDLTCIRLI